MNWFDLLFAGLDMMSAEQQFAFLQTASSSPLGIIGSKATVSEL